MRLFFIDAASKKELFMIHSPRGGEIPRKLDHLNFNGVRHLVERVTWNYQENIISIDLLVIDA